MLTREAIMDFSSTLFLRYGFKKTTMDDVARICRIGKATLYKFFKNKEDLYREIIKREIDEVMGRMDEVVKGLRTTRERLQRLFETEYVLLRGGLNLSEIITDQHEITDPSIKELTEQFYERQRRLIGQILSEGVKAGEIVVEDISLLSLAMMVAGQGLFSYFRDIRNKKKAIRSMEYLISTLFTGIGRRDKPI